MRASRSTTGVRSATTAAGLFLLLGLADVASAEPALPSLVGELAPDSTLVACARASERVEVAANAHLDPACTYTAGFDVVASNVVLDCRGAEIRSPGTSGRGIHVKAPADVALSGVVVRNCVVGGFLNGIRVSRTGFKELAAGAEYDAAFSNVLVENGIVEDTRGSGIFVDGYVTGVTLRDLEIRRAGSVGIYLEAGSKGNAILSNHVHHNGYADVLPGGTPFPLGGIPFRYRGTGREGIAIDGSRDNRVVGNRIHDDAAGGIFLYKNCGEDVTSDPAGWWTRRYGADGNQVLRNRVSDERTGVWIASRASENQLFMDCSDPAYVSDASTRVHEDFADGTLVRGNVFEDVEFGVRVEDDGARVQRNRFRGSGSTRSIVVGTRQRTRVLGRPVAGTVVDRNRSELPSSAGPFAWIHGETGTTFTGNHASDGEVPALVPGTEPPIGPFLFAQEVWIDPYPLDDVLRLNDLQVLGTHNSYHVQVRPEIFGLLEAYSKPLAESLEYSHRPLPQQFGELGIRAIELDVFADPAGGRYADPAGARFAGIPEDLRPNMVEAGMKVLHVQDIDYRSTCRTLKACLSLVRDWSDAHPGHAPIMIQIEAKDDPIPDPYDLGFVVPLPFGAAEFDALDAEIRSVLPDDKLITPDDVRGSHPTLEEAILQDGWPTLRESRGKVLFTLDNGGGYLEDYVSGHPSLSGRVLFVSAPRGTPEAAFLKLNDPVGSQQAIRDAVAAGYIVRTRADGDTVQARTGDTTQREAALASGAHFVSTDYPEPDPRFTDYSVAIPGGTPARCNPVRQPAGCASQDVENPAALDDLPGD
ncbi:right-handed parallel beta-helix repeat-containing protein [bacterium]|nr:right-handed parallel beta-helix repeat-containing protein [bacterium]